MAEYKLPGRLPGLVFLTGVLGVALGAVLLATTPSPDRLPPEHPLFGR